MKEIVSPVPKEALVAELTREKFVRTTNFGNNEIYIFTAHDSPNLMKEVGRLREIAFRMAGGGTGEEVDIDRWDVSSHPYKQLIVWDPREHEILGGYRYILCSEIPLDENGEIDLATTELFGFSEQFRNDYLPYMVELGRSFVQPGFQSSRPERRTLYALDNLWDGLGTIVVNNPEMKYFFGKVTMYTHFNQYARDLILYFLDKHFGDREGLVIPRSALQLTTPIDELEKVFTGASFKENYKIMNKLVREAGENIPPLINSYMGLSPSMLTFGTAINHHFGGVEETGLLITLKDILDEKIERHLLTYMAFQSKQKE
jgi:hypothetical protein